MFRKTTLFALAALAAMPLSLPSPAWATPLETAPAAPARPSMPLPAPRWNHPPEAVRTAAAALHDACAAWPKQIPAVLDPSTTPSGAEDLPYERACTVALDAEGFVQVTLLQGGALGATAAGIAVAMFLVAKFLLFGLVQVIAHGLTIVWDRYRRRSDRWAE